MDRDADGQLTNEDVQLNLATGVFWRNASVDGKLQPRVTLDGIEMADGQGHTLLLAENVNAGAWHSRRTMDLGFVIGYEVLQFETGPTSAGPLKLRDPVRLGRFGISSSVASQPGQAPVPSSHHQGSTIVALCDGSCRALSKDVDHAVYARLMTPAGERYGQIAVPLGAY